MFQTVGTPAVFDGHHKNYDKLFKVPSALPLSLLFWPRASNWVSGAGISSFWQLKSVKQTRIAVANRFNFFMVIYIWLLINMKYMIKYHRSITKV